MTHVLKVIYSNETKYFLIRTKCFPLEILGHVYCDPVHKVADLGVDAGVEVSPTSDAPAHNTSEVSRAVLIVAEHGSTRVSLAAVLAVLPSAEHALGNAEGVFVLTGALINNRHVHLHQLHWAAGAA